MEPTHDVLGMFYESGDNQIMSLELLAIALGLLAIYTAFTILVIFAALFKGISTFADEISGQNVVIYSDNTGAEAATRKGVTKNFDQNALVHTMWKCFAQLNTGVWVERVPTEENLADLPSRECYALLEKLGAVRVEPILANIFAEAQAWSSLSIKDMCGK